MDGDPGRAEVDRYLAALEHPLKPAIVRMRAAVLGADPVITEHVRWNAPSFCHGGVDRVTFRLHPGARFQLVLHRGARVRDDAVDLGGFEDPSGLLTWASPDRAVVDLSRPGAAATHEHDVVALVRRWVRV